MECARGLPAAQRGDGERKAESKAGERARPVQMTRGKRTKITPRYAVRCMTLYE